MMLSSSARSLRVSRVSSRSLHLSVCRSDEAGSSSSANPLQNLASLDLSPSTPARPASRPAPSARSQPLGAGRGTTSGGIHNLRVQQSDRPPRARPSQPDFDGPTESQGPPGQFDNALEELDDWSPQPLSAPSPSSGGPAFRGLDTFNDPNRSLRGPSSTPFASGGRGRGGGGPAGRGRGGTDGGRGRGGARGRGARGGARGGGASSSSRLQVVERSSGVHPELAPSILPPLETLYTSDNYFFGTEDDVPLSETPAPVFPPLDPLQAKLATALDKHLGTNELRVIYDRTPANFLPEPLRGPRPDLIKARMKAYDQMLGPAFEANPGDAAEIVDQVGGEAGLRGERDLERGGKYDRWFVEDANRVMGKDEGAGVIEITDEGGRRARETAKRLARAGISWNGGVHMQQKDEMLKIVEGLMVMPKKKKVAPAAK